jgi:FAD/FMN-containing dehydrogenase
MSFPHRRSPIDGLRSRISGAVITPGDPDYDTARLAWNLTVDQHPALIVVPESVDDVVEAVRHARDAGLGVAVQATGHGVAVEADGCLLVLTHRLDDVHIDADAWTAWIGAGVKWGAVLGPAQAHGLAPLLGSSPDVGAVGYTLGGGMGWLARRFGLSADHVRHLEVVTADGEVRKVSADENADLFWALRGGGGGSLGIVTGMEIDLVPVATVYAGNLLYPAELAREVVARYREWTATAPDELTSSFALMNLPDIDLVPDLLRGRSFVIVRGCYCGPVAEGEEQLRFWRDWRTPEIDLFGPMSFADSAAISMDPVDPTPSLSTADWLDDVDDDLADVLTRHLFERPAELGPSAVLFAAVRHAGGAMSAVDPASAAYSNRDAEYLLQIAGIAPMPEVMAAFKTQVAEIRRDLAGHTTGATYLNFLELDEKRERTRHAFGAESWSRLQALKAEIDPENLFRHGFDLAPERAPVQELVG